MGKGQMQVLVKRKGKKRQGKSQYVSAFQQIEAVRKVGWNTDLPVFQQMQIYLGKEEEAHLITVIFGTVWLWTLG